MPTRPQKYVRFAHRLLRLEPQAYRRLSLGMREIFRRTFPSAALPDPTEPDNERLYRLWRQAHDPDATQLAAQRRIAATRRGPTISIVTPVFRPSANALADAIASVRAQTWERWQLVLVMAGPQPTAVRTAVQAIVREEPRVCVVELATNEGIAGNSNAGLAAATGDYVCFLDHDDQLAPDILFDVAREIERDPALDQVSFDEDKLSADGRVRCDPHFKPCAPSPEHLLSINYPMRSVIRKAVIDAVGGLRREVDGSQDWDLALRLCEHGIVRRHLPRVGYHWRKVEGSAAADATAKPWAFPAQLGALRAHLERRGLPEPTAEHTQLGIVRVKWRPSASVSIVIPTKDRAGLLEACIRSVREKTTYPQPYEILIIDTGSVEDATLLLYDRLAQDPAIRFLSDERRPFNYSRVNNVAAREAKGDVLVFLNNDIEVISPDWLQELVRWAERPEIGCVGPKLLYPDGTLQHAGIVMGMGGHGSHVYQTGPAEHEWGPFGSVEFYRNYLALGGACLAVRRELFESLGRFDEDYELCYSDIDLCLQAAEAGYRNVYTPFARLFHYEGGTRGLHFPPLDVLRASVRMHALVVHGDPFYNSNLSFQERRPTIAVEDDAAARGALLTRIAGMFGMEERWQEALLAERLGKTREWKVYEKLVRSLLPPLSAFASTRPDSGSRLLIVSPDLARSSDSAAGLDRVRTLCADGHFVCVLSPKHGARRDELEEAGARVIVNPMAIEAPHVFDEILKSFDAILPTTALAWPVVLAAHAAGRPVIWLMGESPDGPNFCRREVGATMALTLAQDVVFPPAVQPLFAELVPGRASAELADVVAHAGIHRDLDGAAARTPRA